MEIGQNIKRRRRELDMTLEEVAKQIGISRQTMSRYETGVIGNIPSDKIELLAKALRTTPAYIMGWEEKPPLPSNIIPLPNTYEVPLLGTIACGQPIPAIEDAEETASVPDHVRADFALRCQGDSMINARIFDGDIVYIRQQPDVENGQIAAVRIEDEATLKKVYYNKQDGRLVLRACNPLYSDMVFEGERLNDIEILGLAVGFYSTVRHN